MTCAAGIEIVVTVLHVAYSKTCSLTFLLAKITTVNFDQEANLLLLFFTSVFSSLLCKMVWQLRKLFC